MLKFKRWLNEIKSLEYVDVGHSGDIQYLWMWNDGKLKTLEATEGQSHWNSLGMHYEWKGRYDPEKKIISYIHGLTFSQGHKSPDKKKLDPVVKAALQKKYGRNNVFKGLNYRTGMLEAIKEYSYFDIGHEWKDDFAWYYNEQDDWFEFKQGVPVHESGWPNINFEEVWKGRFDKEKNIVSISPPIYGFYKKQRAKLSIKLKQHLKKAFGNVILKGFSGVKI